jgi:glyoxylase-like metal-dependent hydrolase (beta-lactamase superfamily II)
MDNSTLQVNVLAVNTGDRLVLVDAGSRGKMQPTAGRLLQNLAAAQIKPEEIDTILIKHAHPDHLWGVANASDTERTFPNADYVIGEGELNFWGQPQDPLESHARWAPQHGGAHTRAHLGADHVLCVPKTVSELMT